MNTPSVSDPMQVLDPMSTSNTDDLATGQLIESFTDISHLIEEARDAFDMPSWGRPESEPHPMPREYADYLELHEVVEHEPDEDVAEFVQPRHGEVKVPEDLQEMGVQSTHAVQYPSYKEVKVPLNDDQIVAGLKTPIDGSLRWLAELCKYLLRTAHVRLRVANGKAERMFEK